MRTVSSGAAFSGRSVRAGRAALGNRAIDVGALGAGGVHGGERHVGAELLGAGHLGSGHLQHLLPVLLQLVEDMDIGDGEEDVDAWLGGVLHGVPAGVDVPRDGAGETGDGGAADLFGDGGDGLGVAGRGSGEPGLDEVDPQPLQGAGDLQLLGGAEGDAGGLLAVARGGIEKQYPLAGGQVLVFLCRLLNLRAFVVGDPWVAPGEASLAPTGFGLALPRPQSGRAGEG